MRKSVFSVKELKRIQLLLAASFLEGLLTLIALLVIPTERGSGVFLGYSSARLLMMLGVFAVTGTILGILILLKCNSTFKRKLLATLNQLSRVTCWLLLASLAIVFLLLSFLLLQWLFVATDDFLRAYLQRLTPIVVYAQLLCVQGVFFVRGQYVNRSPLPEGRSDKQAIWTFRAFVLGILTLLPWLLVGEYFAADSAFPAYYVAERYHAAFRIVFPLALFVTALYVQFLFFVLRQQLNCKIPLGWAVAPLFIVVGFYYYNAAIHHAELINNDPIHSDQLAYMEFARTAHETNFSYTGKRNRMPLYPGFQGLFYRPEMGDTNFFTQGKQVNTILSLVLLAGLFFVFRNYLSLHRATVLTLIAAVSLFIFKSAYFTSELLYYSLSFLGYLGMGLMLLTPSLLLGIGTGVILGLTYLTKASILPAVAAFAFAFWVKEGITFFRRERATVEPAEKKERLQRLASFFLVLITLLAVLFPYLRESKQKYGHYFYNVNSTFYMWYDTWKEALEDTAKYGYRERWPNLPPDEIPSFRNYLREHSYSEIGTRLLTGLEKQIIHLSNPYNAVNYVLIYELLLLILVLWAGWEKISQMIKEYFPLLLFFLLNFVGYLVLYGWYFPIAGGPRFIYGLFLPVAFFVFIATDFLLDRIKSTEINGGFAWISLVDAIVLATLLVDFTYVITTKLPNGYFGS